MLLRAVSELPPDQVSCRTMPLQQQRQHGGHHAHSAAGDEDRRLSPHRANGHADARRAGVWLSVSSSALLGAGGGGGLGAGGGLDTLQPPPPSKPVPIGEPDYAKHSQHRRRQAHHSGGAGSGSASSSVASSSSSCSFMSSSSRHAAGDAADPNMLSTSSLFSVAHTRSLRAGIGAPSLAKPHFELLVTQLRKVHYVC